MATVLITGANRGIGLGLAKAYVHKGDQVIALCRHLSPEIEELENVRILEGLDVRDEKNLQKASEELRKEGIQIDILINNAGIAYSDELSSMHAEDYKHIEEEFAVDALGPLKVTNAFLPLIPRGGKIAMVTSRMGSIGDGPSGGHYGYRMSKAALNMLGALLRKDLEEREIAVELIHPGYVMTDMNDGYGEKTPEETAEQIYARISELSMKNSGHFVHAEGGELPW